MKFLHMKFLHNVTSSSRGLAILALVLSFLAIIAIAAFSSNERNAQATHGPVTVNSVTASCSGSTQVMGMVSLTNETDETQIGSLLLVLE